MTEKKKRYVQKIWRFNTKFLAVTKPLTYIGPALLIFDAILLTVNCVAIKLWNWSWPSTNSYVQVSFTVAIWTSIFWAHMYRGIVRVGLFDKKFPKWLLLTIGIIGDVLGIACYLVLGSAQIYLTNQYFTFKTMTSTMRGHLPLWPFALIMCIGAFLFALTFVFNIFKRFAFEGDYLPNRQILLDAGIDEKELNGFEFLT